MKKKQSNPDLPDVNVLVALFDSAHIHHEMAHNWFAHARVHAWATCPLTQSGFLRVVSNPSYPNISLSPTEAAAYLRMIIDNHRKTHVFLHDDTQLCDDALFDLSALYGYRQLTDLHLIGICSRHGCRLVTFDRGIQSTMSALRSGTVEILLLSE